MAKSALHGAGRLFLIVLVIYALSGCGSTIAEPTADPAAPSPMVTVPNELPVALTLRGHFDPQELRALDEEIALFEQENPGAKVAVLEATEVEEERQQAFAELLAGSDTSTDLYVLEAGWVAEFEARGWLVPLDDYVPAQGSDLRRLLSDPGRAQTLGGKLVALSSSCLPGKMVAISSHSRYPVQAFRFLASLLRCGM